ncbi:MAG: LuxR C-terminal-related transcriptional regulator [Spirochaetaceae bacterium]|jgi:DNA-binding NarL/FixJ family response regulator|nr:LuxR C-terminal-related transcriptional regulator [Spirochaetaceae bacterium]
MTNSAIAKNIMELKTVERNIVKGIANGFTNKEIAKILGLKTGTVGNYVSRILHKIGLQHRTQIAIFALQNGGRSEAEYSR